MDHAKSYKALINIQEDTTNVLQYLYEYGLYSNDLWMRVRTLDSAFIRLTNDIYVKKWEKRCLR